MCLWVFQCFHNSYTTTFMPPNYCHCGDKAGPYVKVSLQAFFPEREKKKRHKKSPQTSRLSCLHGLFRCKMTIAKQSSVLVTCHGGSWQERLHCMQTHADSRRASTLFYSRSLFKEQVHCSRPSLAIGVAIIPYAPRSCTQCIIYGARPAPCE